MSQKRAIDFEDGVAMVVTDLHGEGEVYYCLRDKFLTLHEKGEVARFIICGDLIHGYGDEDKDFSLEMLLDVMRLQTEMGRETVTMLLGNHEMPHIYSIMLSKGDIEFTPRFERKLANLDKQPDSHYCRADVIDFLMSLPFYIRTKAGVLIAHSGATFEVNSEDVAKQVLDFDHAALLEFGDEQMAEYQMEDVRSDFTYREHVRRYLAVDDPQDSRFFHLVRGTLISRNHPDFDLLWEVLFSMNERPMGVEVYGRAAQNFLRHISAHSPHEQRTIVSGHMGVQGGYTEVGTYQLRIASYAHAHPHEEGCYLLLDCAKRVETAAELTLGLRRTFDD